MQQRHKADALFTAPATRSITRSATRSASMRRAAALTRTLTVVALMLPAAPVFAEFFVDVGAHSSRIEADSAGIAGTTRTTESGLHLGAGASRPVGDRGEFGARVEVDRVGSDSLLAVRALDYRRHISDRFAVSAFLGAARLDRGTPAYGYYLGAGFQLKDLIPRWDVNIDLRFGDKLARDNLLPTDPQNSADSFYDVSGISVYLSYRF